MSCKTHAVGKQCFTVVLTLLVVFLAACGGGGGDGGGGVPPTVPATPASLKATAVSSSSINLTWTDASGNEDGFRVYRGSTSAVVTTLIANLGAGSTSYSDNTGLAASTTYYYKVTAFNSVGESAASNIDNATTNNDVPVAPASLKATAVSISRIDLVWVDASANEDGFRVFRGLDLAAVTNNIATLGPGVQSYSDNNGLSASTNYYYKVTAFNSVGESAASNIDNATTPVDPSFVIPAAPTNLVAALASGSAVGLTWSDASDNENGFRVYRGTGASPASFPLIATLVANTTSYSDDTASGTTTYVYRVTAFNAGGESPPVQSNSVGTPTVVTSVAGGNRHSLAVKSDGTVWAWGSNDSGALGVGTGVANSNVPILVPGLSSMTAVSAGDGHSLALKSDGTIMAWGQNFFGGVGSGDNVTPQPRPVQVIGPGGVGVFNNVAAVSAGGFFSVALRNDGTVWVWGSGFFGQLGNGTTDIPSVTPVQVRGPGGVGFLGNVVAVSASQNHALALRNDGTVWAWGKNDLGQLGDGTTTNRNSPVQVRGPGGVGVLGNVVAISGSESHSMALLNDGTVRAWGDNLFGELGDGTTTQSDFPVTVSGLDNVVEISAGGYFSVGRKNDGTIWAWGSDERGQIGDGTPINLKILTPVSVSGLGNGLKISAAKDHSLVLRGDRTVYAWGSNVFGQIGDGTTTDRPAPVPLAGF